MIPERPNNSAQVRLSRRQVVSKILEYLEKDEMIRLQRVCRFWYDYLVPISLPKIEVKLQIHPPEGLFAINGNQVQSSRRSTFKESMLVNKDDGGASAYLVTPGVCAVPLWCGHGSVWYYDAIQDIWQELGFHAKRVTCTWKRISGKKPVTSIHTKSHPKEGTFSMNGTAVYQYFKDSCLLCQEHGGDGASAPVPGIVQAFVNTF